MALAGLAAKAEPDLLAAHLRVTVAERGQAERRVEARILIVADADERSVEKPDDRRQHLPSRQTARPQVAIHLSPDPRQVLPELDHPAELRGVARLAPRRVIAVLLAAPRIAAAGEDMALAIGADPDLV